MLHSLEKISKSRRSLWKKEAVAYGRNRTQPKSRYTLETIKQALDDISGSHYITRDASTKKPVLHVESDSEPNESFYMNEDLVEL